MARSYRRDGKDGASLEPLKFYANPITTAPRATLVTAPTTGNADKDKPPA
jgi:hypothetical protein